MSNFWFCKYLTGRLKLTTHPGGRDIIEEHAGKDATKYFLNIGHSSEAKNNLKALKIGEVAEEKLDRKQYHNVKNDKKPNQ
ncbi:unnamed protein product [Acanthoscelides obtectus]|nr:unnamed protein product [Acanthoscelides obtectus]CAK1622401.1 Cytochrome b5 [Acanthoscelides obtectus]